MALTQNFRGTLTARIRRDPLFREAFFAEAVNLLFVGDSAAGRAALRDLANSRGASKSSGGVRT